jgi:lipoprotein-releasing system permease protein
VTGILQLSGQLDHSFAMIPMQDAQQYLEMGSSVTGIAIKVTDVSMPTSWCATPAR